MVGLPIAPADSTTSSTPTSCGPVRRPQPHAGHPAARDHQPVGDGVGQHRTPARAWNAVAEPGAGGGASRRGRGR